MTTRHKIKVRDGKYSYREIANDYRLWQEYADPDGLDSKEYFDAQTIKEKVEFLAACFGPEKD